MYILIHSYTYIYMFTHRLHFHTCALMHLHTCTFKYQHIPMHSYCVNVTNVDMQISKNFQFNFTIPVLTVWRIPSLSLNISWFDVLALPALSFNITWFEMLTLPGLKRLAELQVTNRLWKLFPCDSLFRNNSSTHPPLSLHARLTAVSLPTLTGF